MQQSITLRPARRSFSIKEWMKGKSKQAAVWLNATSRHFCILMEEPVTRITVIRVHLIFLGMLIVAGLAEQHPVATLPILALVVQQTFKLKYQDK